MQSPKVPWPNAVLVVLVIALGGCGGSASVGLPAHLSELYVANAGDNSITVYAPGANGDVAPLRIVRGDIPFLRTLSLLGILRVVGVRFGNPAGVAVDAAGNLYVSDVDSVNVYPPGARGYATPLRTIRGVRNGPNASGGVAVDTSGNLYVSDGNEGINVYPPGASGHAVPLRTIRGARTRLDSPVGVALDAAGNLYVSNITTNTITVYATGASGNVAPIRTIYGDLPPPWVIHWDLRTLKGTRSSLSGPLGVALDSAGNVYVSNRGGRGITVYPPGASGYLPPFRTIGDGLKYPAGVALDHAGNLYVSTSDNSITVYALDTGGNGAPLRTIKGARTGLNDPRFIFLRP